MGLLSSSIISLQHIPMHCEFIFTWMIWNFAIHWVVPKKHSITAVYFQIGNVEQRHLSSLKSIYVACIAKTSHVKKYGLHKIACTMCWKV